jgi:hypothetical protein
MGVLTDPACPLRHTWVELALKSQRNRSKLQQLMYKSGSATVEFAGEFYGPPNPDDKLPASIKKGYHPGWGHLGAFPTKLIVFEIDSVSIASSSPSK